MLFHRAEVRKGRAQKKESPKSRRPFEPEPEGGFSTCAARKHQASTGKPADDKEKAGRPKTICRQKFGLQRTEARSSGSGGNGTAGCPT